MLMNEVVNKAIKEDSYYKRIGIENVADVTDHWNQSKNFKDLGVELTEDEVAKFLFGCYVDGSFPTKLKEVSGWG